MKKTLWILLGLALALALALNAVAAPDGALTRAYQAGQALLFETEYVTLTGSAEFSLDGARFKTVKAEYRQDGYRSYWDYQLLTPRQDGSPDRESGFTVFADDSDISVMEKVYPGTYRMGTDAPQTTLVRRSALMDQVAGLAGIAVSQLEPLLGDAVKVTADNHAGLSFTVTLNRENMTELADAAFNLCAQMIVQRAIMPVSADDRPFYDVAMSIEGFPTIASGIVACTQRYDLNSAEVTVTLDGNGRVRSVSGTVAVDLVTLEDGVRRLDVTFSLNAGQYGTTTAKPFDPTGLTMRYAE